MSKIIALYSSGPSSGKSEVARILREKFSFSPVKLAEPLKAMIGVLLLQIGVRALELPRYIEGDLKETPIPGLGNRTPRYLFQTLGTEWGRDLVAKTLWTSVCVGRCNRELAWGRSVVVDDMRFPNEFEALKGAGAVLVKVTRPGVVAPKGHASEGLLDDLLFDFEVHNSGTLDDLELSTRTLLETSRL